MEYFKIVLGVVKSNSQLSKKCFLFSLKKVTQKGGNKRRNSILITPFQIQRETENQLLKMKT